MSWRLTSPKTLISHWPLNGHAQDVVRKNHGTWNGTKKYTEGPFGKQVADLNGSSWVDAGSDSSLEFSNAVMTISLWFIPDVLANDTLIGTTIGGFMPYQSVITVGGTIYFLQSEDDVGWQTAAQTPGILSVGDYYHYAAVNDGINATVYINGEFQVVDTNPAVSAMALTSFAIGANTNGSVAIDGKIWDVRLHNVALTQDEIIKLIGKQ